MFSYIYLIVQQQDKQDKQEFDFLAAFKTIQ